MRFSDEMFWGTQKKLLIDRFSSVLEEISFLSFSILSWNFDDIILVLITKGWWNMLKTAFRNFTMCQTPAPEYQVLRLNVLANGLTYYLCRYLGKN